jgi:2-polyprenyl-3-methyl-5-hydroxy-6-metoxy-1,4-benzoquinol methylase
VLLTISTSHKPATDLGYLLHKHPDRFQSFDLSFGKAHVFYPEVAEDRCCACLLLDVDPVGMVRSRNRNQSFLLGHYVNDRPYVASSFMSVAISQVFGTALGGRCNDRPELVSTPIPLEARIDVLPVRGCQDRRNSGTANENSLEAARATNSESAETSRRPEMLYRIFEPLGYTVEATRHPLDERFPEWGESTYYSVSISGTKPLVELLTHLYVLIPVFDNNKHYFVGDDELEKLLAKGALTFAEGKNTVSGAREDQTRADQHNEQTALNKSTAGGWLAQHPEKEQITRRYLKHQSSLYRQALARLVEEDEAGSLDDDRAEEGREGILEKPLSLNEQRHGTVLAALRASGARKVLDLGCGEGKLLRELLKDKQFDQIVGMDVSIRALEIAHKRLKLDRLPDRQAERLKLIHGSLIYRDKRLEGFDAAAIVEVIEHLDPPRLAALERAVFEFARPKTVIVTTPNSEYNVIWETLPAGKFRHSDHRFEWTRDELQDWGNRVAEQHGYTVRYLPVGPVDEKVGSPTQMGVFEKVRGEATSDG